MGFQAVEIQPHGGSPCIPQVYFPITIKSEEQLETRIKSEGLVQHPMPYADFFKLDLKLYAHPSDGIPVIGSDPGCSPATFLINPLNGLATRKIIGKALVVRANHTDLSPYLIYRLVYWIYEYGDGGKAAANRARPHWLKKNWEKLNLDEGYIAIGPELWVGGWFPPMYESPKDRFKKGAWVLIWGLKSAKALNGLCGIIVSYNQKKKRWCVSTASGLKGIRSPNLVDVPPQQSCTTLCAACSVYGAMCQEAADRQTVDGFSLYNPHFNKYS